MTPSRSMANSAARTSTRGGPSPAAAGKRKTPRSSRLYQRHQPSSYQARILSRSPLRLRKTNQCPDRGSSPRAWRTSALSPSNDLRRSAGSAHRKMRMAGDRLSMTVPPARAGARGGRPGRSPAGCEGTARWRGRVQGAAFGRGNRAGRGQAGRSPGREPGPPAPGGRVAGAFVARRRRTGRRGGGVRRRRGQKVRCLASARSAVASALPCGDRGACRVAWKDLQDRVKNDHVPKVITGTRTGSTVRLRLVHAQQDEVIGEATLLQHTIGYPAVVGECLDRVLGVVIVPRHAIMVEECEQLALVLQEPLLVTVG